MLVLNLPMLKRTELIHVGFGHFIATNKIDAILKPGLTPVKRVVIESRNDDWVIDLTSGRRTQSVIFARSEYIILADPSPDILRKRMSGLE